MCSAKCCILSATKMEVFKHACVLGSAMAVCITFCNILCMRTVLVSVLLSVFSWHFISHQELQQIWRAIFSLAAYVISCFPWWQTCCYKNPAALLPGEHDWQESASDINQGSSFSQTLWTSSRFDNKVVSKANLEVKSTHLRLPYISIPSSSS